MAERYATARADHHRILRAAFAEHDGQEIDTQEYNPQWGVLLDQLWVR